MIDKSRIAGQRIVSLRTWGKHFLIEFADFTIRIHLMMYGRYCINERKPDKPIRLGLHFAGGQELNFYNCSVRYLEGGLDDTYDWSGDVMSDTWNAAAARKKLRKMVEEARIYSFQFLEWKREFVLRKHWLVHNKGVCPRCEIKLHRAYLGTTNRRTFFCERCQIRYSPPPARRGARPPAGKSRRTADPRP